LVIEPAPHRRLRLYAGDDPVTDPDTESFHADRCANFDELSLADHTPGTLADFWFGGHWVLRNCTIELTLDFDEARDVDIEWGLNTLNSKVEFYTYKRTRELIYTGIP
jgi:hypothetical protein